MNSLIKSFIIFLVTVVVFSNYNNVLAQDKFKSVKIGNQVWMTENLNVEKFSNGLVIKEAKTADEWVSAAMEGKPAWCYYENDPEKGKKYGKLYNWYAVYDYRGLAPDGWHIPTKAELEALINIYSLNTQALKAKGVGYGDGVGTNTSGFTALLAGARYKDGSFGSLGQEANFWSSTGKEQDILSAYIFLIRDINDSGIYDSPIDSGYSIRCIKD